MYIKQILSSQKIDKIINKNYYQGHQALGLWGLPSEWRQVLSYRDWTQLRCLYIGNCLIDDNALIQILSISWPHLQKLELTQNKLSPKGLSTLLNFPSLPRLKQIGLSSNPIGKRGAQLLTKSDIPVLQKLWISDIGLGNYGSMILNKGDWPLLTTLNISKNKIGVDGYDGICNNSWGKMIQHMYEVKEAINVIRMVTVNSKCNLHWICYNGQLRQDIKNILYIRFKDQ